MRHIPWNEKDSLVCLIHITGVPFSCRFSIHVFTALDSSSELSQLFWGPWPISSPQLHTQCRGADDSLESTGRSKFIRLACRTLQGSLNNFPASVHLLPPSLSPKNMCCSRFQCVHICSYPMWVYSSLHAMSLHNYTRSSCLIS